MRGPDLLTISKEFAFSASHQLSHLPTDHPCSRLHGHNYVVSLELACQAAELTETGFVRDYRDLADFKKWLDAEVDHRHLNDVIVGRNPSAENIAIWIYEIWCRRLPELTRIRISETPKTWATYEGPTSSPVAPAGNGAHREHTAA